MRKIGKSLLNCQNRLCLGYFFSRNKNTFCLPDDPGHLPMAICRCFASKKSREVPWRVSPPVISRGDNKLLDNNESTLTIPQHAVDKSHNKSSTTIPPPSSSRAVHCHIAERGRSGRTKNHLLPLSSRVSNMNSHLVNHTKKSMGVPPVLSLSKTLDPEREELLSMLAADGPHQQTQINRHLEAHNPSTGICYDFSKDHIEHNFDFPPSWFVSDLSTEQNYGIDVRDSNLQTTSKMPRGRRQKNIECHGEFIEVRQTLDYNFHYNYIPERQLFQDQIIGHKLDDPVITDLHGMTCARPERPWLVFTAGAYGAGKSYTIDVLVEKGRFPLSAFVKVDPDEIRRMLPEFQIYVNQESTRDIAGELTRKEAGYICEILCAEALKEGKNVLVDGSLRDSEWYKRYFRALRHGYPSLRIAILHITAPWEAVLERTAQRGLETGRIIPLQTLERAFDEVPRSVQELSPLADYVCELRNGTGQDIEITTEGQTWHRFKSKWYQICAEWY